MNFCKKKLPKEPVKNSVLIELLFAFEQKHTVCGGRDITLMIVPAPTKSSSHFLRYIKSPQESRGQTHLSLLKICSPLCLRNFFIRLRDLLL